MAGIVVAKFCDLERSRMQKMRILTIIAAFMVIGIAFVTADEETPPSTVTQTEGMRIALEISRFLICWSMEIYRASF